MARTKSMFTHCNLMLLIDAWNFSATLARLYLPHSWGLGQRFIAPSFLVGEGWELS